MACLRRYARHRLARLVVLATNLGLALASLGLWVIAFTQGLSWRADFTMLYTGASMVRSGLSDGLYDLGMQAAMQQQILEGLYLAGGLLPFNYPPHLALLLTPIAWLSLDQAYLVWSALQFATLACAGWMLSRHLRAEGASAQTRCMAIAGVAALPFVGSALLLGALSILMLVGWLGYALAFRRGKSGWAAFWVLVMTLKPQVAVVPALVLLASRRWRAVGLVVGIGLALVLITSSVLQPSAWLGFLETLLRSFQGDASLGIVPGSMVNLRGLLATLSGDRARTAVSLVTTLGFALSLLAVIWLWRAEEEDRADLDLRMAFVLLLGILFSPHAYPQDVVLLVVPTLLFWCYLRHAGRHGQLFGSVALICPALFWITERFLRDVLSGAPVPALVMVGLGAVMLPALLRHRRSSGLPNCSGSADSP